MLDFGLPVVIALLVWWFSTGAILFLVGMAPSTYRWTMAGASAVMAVGVYQMVQFSGDTSVVGAYVSFLGGLAVWAWHETSFLTGTLTGPRRQACPKDCRGWRHFVHGVEAILHHEIAIILTAGILVAVTWGAPNQVGTWTFLILWVMRLSAKLNIFLGASNVPEEFLAPHMAYLGSFFRKRRMNLLFPVSITASTAVAVLLGLHAFAASATPFETAAYMLLFTFMALAILEHWFLMLPVPVAAIWQWGFQSRRQSRRGPARPAGRPAKSWAPALGPTAAAETASPADSRRPQAAGPTWTNDAES